MNREALIQLRRVVENAPDRLFLMNHFGLVLPDCGTAHCAAGWAASDPWFVARGLFGKNSVGRGFIPAYRGFDGFRALGEFFELSPDQAAALFGGSLAYVSASEVVDPAECAVPLWHGHDAKQSVLKNIDRLLSGKEPVDVYAEDEVEDEECVA